MFLSILMVRGEAASTRREYFENGPLEPGYKMCSLQKKKPLKWSPQKRSTYHELLSNFIFPLDLDNGARICSACRIALTSSKYKQSAETVVDVSKHFQFSLFWNGKGAHMLKKYHCKFQRVGSKCAKAGVQFSSELIYVLQFSQHF